MTDNDFNAKKLTFINYIWFDVYIYKSISAMAMNRCAVNDLHSTLDLELNKVFCLLYVREWICELVTVYRSLVCRIYVTGIIWI